MLEERTITKKFEFVVTEDEGKNVKMSATNKGFSPLEIIGVLICEANNIHRKVAERDDCSISVDKGLEEGNER